MRTKLAALFLVSLGSPAFAHRLDEYLQATLVSIHKDRVELFMRLIPGVAVSSAVLATIGTRTEGVISEVQQRLYAEQVLRDMSLSVDNSPLEPRLVSVNFPSVQAIKEGTGEIQIELNADLPQGRDVNRKLVLENHHQEPISAY